jgi:hypothetical protein
MSTWKIRGCCPHRKARCSTWNIGAVVARTKSPIPRGTSLAEGPGSTGLRSRIKNWDVPRGTSLLGSPTAVPIKSAMFHVEHRACYQALRTKTRCSTWNICRSCSPRQKAHVPRGTFLAERFCSLSGSGAQKLGMFHGNIRPAKSPGTKTCDVPRGTSLAGGSRLPKAVSRDQELGMFHVEHLTQLPHPDKKVRCSTWNIFG